MPQSFCVFLTCFGWGYFFHEVLAKTNRDLKARMERLGHHQEEVGNV